MGAKLGLLVALVLVALAAASDVDNYVFVEFRQEAYFPYLVKNNTVEPVPIVYLVVMRDVVVQRSPPTPRCICHRISTSQYRGTSLARGRPGSQARQGPRR